MYVIVMKRNGGRDYVGLLNEGLIYPTKESAEKAIEEETTKDLQLNFKHYYKIEPVQIKLTEK